MIVKTDFLGHRKTSKLVRLTGNAAAPLALIRLWIYCQNEHRWEFSGMTPEALADVCEWDCPNHKCDQALLECKWVDALPGGGFKVHDWEIHNKQLVTQWGNGKFGGLGGNQTNPKGSQRVAKDHPSHQSIQSNQSSQSSGQRMYVLTEQEKAAKEEIGEIDSRCSVFATETRFHTTEDQKRHKELKSKLVQIRKDKQQIQPERPEPNPQPPIQNDNN